MPERTRPEPQHIPASTYRLQLNRDFTFRQALELVDYLSELGISHVYVSPILMAVPGSPHGYDVTSHSRVNPDLGTLDDFRRLSARLAEYGMGIIADVVPNHMAIGHPSNEWWWAVLENGPSSRFARCFDIDWHPPKSDLANKVLCPILGDQYGRVLEDQQISITWCERGFCVSVYDRLLPLAVHSWSVLLQPALERLRERLCPGHEAVVELADIVEVVAKLAASGEVDAEQAGERQRDTEILRQRLARLAASSDEARLAVDDTRQEINGVRGDPRSFDRLEELLARQFYRLCYWRVASDEINYRRFFDVNNLAAIRVEDPEVFAAVHALIFELIREGHIAGLRVDHPDGLLDPVEYFQRLQAGCAGAAGLTQPFYVVSEKIFAGDERLRTDWEIEGTTGYDFLGVLNGLFVDRRGRRAFQHLYKSFTGCARANGDMVYGCKKLILQTSLASELNLLTNKLDRISEQHRWSRDFTRQSLRHVLRETIACFPIYRTYTQERAARVDPEDERHIRLALSVAKRRNPATSGSIFEFLESVLLLDDPVGIDAAQRVQRRQFVLSFQQFTGPLMAKGLEDTAFYRYTPLASLNEVGAQFQRFGTAPADLHALNQRHTAWWPHTMLATSTHDSKRSEDVRARLNVLSEIPGEWYRAIRHWRDLNLRHKTNLGPEVPSGAEEYFFYQDLVGAWPPEELTAEGRDDLRARMQAHMQKALREAKVNTSWINPNEAYERAMAHFIDATLDPGDGNPFPGEVARFVANLRHAGLWNSLSQTLLKIASPGVPDFYQGSEIWSLNLVDPDNRRPVDYVRRRCLLHHLQMLEAQGVDALVQAVMRDPANGLVKLYVTSRALRFRRLQQHVFAKGGYVPLRGAGDRQAHVLSFARVLGHRTVIAAAGRYFMRLGPADQPPVDDAVWGDSVLEIRREFGSAVYRDVFTNRLIDVEKRKGKHVLPLASVFRHLPVALLEGMERQAGAVFSENAVDQRKATSKAPLTGR